MSTSLLEPKHGSELSFTAREARVLKAIKAVQVGIPVVVLDDEKRENEADLIVAAEKLTEQSMAQMIRYGSGIVCLCLTDPDLVRLELPQMVANNECVNHTAFTVTIEARDGVSTGVSAKDRTTTIKTAINPQATAHDIVRPGHVFPLRAQPEDVLARRGHTESSVCLARLAGLRPQGVLCELMHDDGTMMRHDAALAFAEKNGMPFLYVEDLVRYREAHA